MEVSAWIDEIIDDCLQSSDCSNEDMIFIDRLKLKSILDDKCSEIGLVIE